MNPQQDALIRQAADLENTTVTAFVLDSVTARAEQVVWRHRDLVLANEDFGRFIAEPDKPATPVPELAAPFASGNDQLAKLLPPAKPPPPGLS